MRRLALLVAKDLRRKARSPLGFLVVLSFPLVFAGLIALVFGTEGGDLPKVRLLIENRDQGLVASALASVFTSKEAAEHFDVRTVAKGEGRPILEAGDASALLVLPEDLTSDLIDGRPVTLELVRNPAEGIFPEIAEQIARILAEVLDGGARVLRDPLDQLRPYLGEESAAPSDASVAEIAVAFKRTLTGAGTFVLPPAITLAGAFGEAAGDEPRGETSSTIFLSVLPGVAVYALFLVGDNAMRDVLAEGTLGTLKRQLAGPLGAGTILIGKAIYSGVLSLAALAVFSAVAAAFVPAAPSPLGFLALSLALTLAVVGTAATIYGLARTERRGATFASIVYLTMGFLGGSFVNVDNLSRTMRAIARWTPFYWANAGYRTLLEKGGGLGDVLPNVAVLAITGVALLAAGALFLGRAVRRGGATA